MTRLATDAQCHGVARGFEVADPVGEFLEGIGLGKLFSDGGRRLNFLQIFSQPEVELPGNVLRDGFDVADNQILKRLCSVTRTASLGVGCNLTHLGNKRIRAMLFRQLIFIALFPLHARRTDMHGRNPHFAR